MQNAIDKKATAQAIRMCELSGLSGTAEALKNILAELTKPNSVVKEPQPHNVAETQQLD
jgi:hypothetical protein